MDYSEPCQYSIRLIEKLKSLDTKNILDFDLINKAIYWARKYHGDQKRKSGEAYYTHPLEVAYMISEHNLKTDVIVASILHDIIEDTEITVGMIFDNFGQRIAQMVDRLTRDRPDGTKLRVEEIINNAYKLKDQEVLMIKLIDRLHNMQTIGTLKPEKQNIITHETADHFIILSIYVEHNYLSEKLTNLCFQHLHIKSNLMKIQKQNFSFEDNSQSLFPTFQNEVFQMCNL